jgi:hypothetical protein
MKSSCFRGVSLIMAAACALLAVVGCQSYSEPASSAPVVRVADVRGHARCAAAGQPWRKLSARDTLAPASLVQTAVDSAVDIALEGEAGRAGASYQMLLHSDTVVFIEELPGAFADGAKLRLELRLGSLTFVSPTAGPGPACEIRFTNGVAEARQATFDLRSDGQVKVGRGTVTMKLIGDQPPVIVGAGNQYNPQTGELTQLPANVVVEQPIRTPVARRPAQPWLPVPMRKY